MFNKDHLNCSVYKALNGKNYRQPKLVDKGAVANFFGSLGYEVRTVEQKYRHVHGQLAKNNSLLFFKMASTADISDCTYNELLYNQIVGKKITESGLNHFHLPVAVVTGWFNKKFYFISEYFPGECLATKSPPSTKNLQSWIDVIVEAVLFLAGMDKIILPRDKNELGKVTLCTNYLNMQNMIIKKDLTEFGLEQIARIGESIIDIKETGMSHGDFVPWHMIKEKNMFVLIDSELASAKMPVYYDVAYFYDRVFTAAQSPDLAKEFIGKFRNSLRTKEKSTFDKAIKPLIASRILWGFWRNKNYNKDDFSWNFKLKRDFLNDDFY